MSVDVKDFRRHLEDADKRKPEPERDLLPQATSDKAATGDARLDKLIRAIEAHLQQADKEHTALAKAGIAAPEDKVYRTYQIQASFVSGLMKGLLIAQELPAKIIVEEKPNSLLIH